MSYCARELPAICSFALFVSEKPTYFARMSNTMMLYQQINGGDYAFSESASMVGPAPAELDSISAYQSYGQEEGDTGGLSTGFEALRLKLKRREYLVIIHNQSKKRR